MKEDVCEILKYATTILELGHTFWGLMDIVNRYAKGRRGARMACYVNLEQALRSNDDHTLLNSGDRVCFSIRDFNGELLPKCDGLEVSKPFETGN